ncbi:hypothetical protein LEP1GSC052_1557 [Leptospira kmetyi serovar Malaysia str. Bejo-Iso9]|nr:hypothetical protein LEP1GSC052_1557 [Leptospira kmetyi serovar Malaysia str. Bejo-Iso9]
MNAVFILKYLTYKVVPAIRTRNKKLIEASPVSEHSAPTVLDSKKRRGEYYKNEIYKK